MADNYRFRFEVKPNRYCYVQTEDQQDIGRAIKTRLAGRWRIPSWCFHLKSGGHLAALKAHLGNEFFAAIDLTNFFGTVGRSKITRALKRIGFSYLEAAEIASASTVRDGNRTFLPYGFVQSPLIASIAFAESHLGRQLTQLRSNGVQVSLYVDDLVLSHPHDDAVLGTALDIVVEAANVSGFEVNDTKLQRPARSVEAFNIRLSKCGLQLVPERLLNFRQRMAGTVADASAMATINYVDMIDPHQADVLRAEVGLTSVGR